MVKKLKVGFIGLGLMGNPMAKNIQKAGFPLIVYNRTHKKTLEFRKLGITVASSPAELAGQVDVIVTMVTGPKDVKEVLLGKNGVVRSAKKGLIVIDMSTIGPEAAKEIAGNLAKKEIEFIDAPVTGSTPKAIIGELTIFIGAKKPILGKVGTVLATMGTNLQYMGPVGSGQATKLVNNHLVATTLIALCEGLLLADAQGIARQKVARALEQTPVFSPFMRLKLPLLLKKKFPTLFSLANMAKDLNLAVKEAGKGKKKLRLLEIATQCHNQGLKLGFGSEDNSAIFKVLEKKV